MSLDPRAIEVIGEVAGARANLLEAVAIQDVRKDAYDSRTRSGRHTLADAYTGEDGVVDPADVPSLVRASLELEGADSFDAERVAEEIEAFQKPSETPGLLLVTRSQYLGDKGVAVVFNGPNKPVNTTINLKPSPDYYPGAYDLHISGGTSDSPIVSSMASRYSGATTGKYKLGTTGEVEALDLTNMIGIGNSSSHSAKKEFTEMMARYARGGDIRESLILFDEAAIDYLDASLRIDGRRAFERMRNGFALEDPRDVPEDLPLIMMAKAMMGAELSEVEQRMAGSLAFRLKALGAVESYAERLARDASSSPKVETEDPKALSAPLLLSGDLLRFVGIGKEGIDLAAQKGVARAGSVLTEEDYQTLISRIETGKKRKIRELVEPALTQTVERVQEGLDEARDITGLQVDTLPLIMSAFSDDSLFRRMTDPKNTREGKGVARDALIAYSKRAQSFRQPETE